MLKIMEKCGSLSLGLALVMGCGVDDKQALLGSAPIAGRAGVVGEGAIPAGSGVRDGAAGSSGNSSAGSVGQTANVGGAGEPVAALSAAGGASLSMAGTSGTQNGSTGTAGGASSAGDAGSTGAAGSAPAIGTCGDHKTDPGEACDGDCPTTCDDGNPCTVDALLGTPIDCSVTCNHTAITTNATGDSCCPSGANARTDSDCPTTCGDGLVTGNETCDPRGDVTCPTSCDDGQSCTADTLAGSACDSYCTHTQIVAAVGGDGCCLPGPTGVLDSDCANYNALGPLSGWTGTWAYAANADASVVVGVVANSLNDIAGEKTHAFIWTATHGISMLPTPSQGCSAALGVDDYAIYGWHAEQSDCSDHHAVAWPLNGGAPTVYFQQGGRSEVVASVEQGRTVVGSCGVGGYDLCAWENPQTAPTVLAVADTTKGQYYRVGDASLTGDVVGTLHGSAPTLTAFRWSRSAGVQALDCNGNSCIGEAISADGRVVAVTSFDAGVDNEHLALWTGTSSLEILPVRGRGAALNKDGSRVFGGGSSWDTVNGEQSLGTILGDPPYYAVVDVSEDGKVVVANRSPSADRFIAVTTKLP